MNLQSLSATTSPWVISRPRQDQAPTTSWEIKTEDLIKKGDQTVALTSSLVKLERKAVELGNTLRKILDELAEKLVDELHKNQIDTYLNLIKEIREDFKEFCKQRKQIEKELIDKLDPKNPYLENWNNLQFHLYKISTILTWLNNFYNLPQEVHIFWINGRILFSSFESLKKTHYANLSATEICEIKENFNELKKYLSENPQIRQLLLKLWEKNFYPAPTSFYLTENSRNKIIYTKMEGLKKEMEAYSDTLYEQCLEKWNEALFHLLKIEIFLEKIDFFYSQLNPVKILIERIETLNLNARQSLQELCEQSKKSTPNMSHLRERLKKLDASLIDLLEEKKSILKKYRQFIESSQEEENVKKERLIYSHLKNFVFNVKNPIESIMILLRDEFDELNIFRELNFKELKNLWAMIQERLPNTGRQLDKFVDAYGNRGLPFFSYFTGNTYAVSENYKNLCLEEDPFISENRINIFLGLEK